jgi:hypothetical protein
MSRLSRKEFKELLVEWNKNFSSQRKESKDVSEGIMKNAAFGLGAVISLLGGFANIPTANALPASKIAIQLDDAFNGKYSFLENENGDLIVIASRSGNEKVILTGDQCKNISQDELDDALKIASPKLVDDKLKAAAETTDDSQKKQNQTKSGGKSVAERIKSMKSSVKKQLIAEFKGDESEGKFNIEASQLDIAADSSFNKNKKIQEEFGSQENFYIFLIMKNYSRFRQYLPN